MRREQDIQQKTPPLPDGYTRLKSIGSTATCVAAYIETDFKPNYLWTVRGEVQVINEPVIGDVNHALWICGPYSTSGSGRQCAIAMFFMAGSLRLDTIFGQYVNGAFAAKESYAGEVFAFEASKDFTALNGATVSGKAYRSGTSGTNFTLFNFDIANKNIRYNNHRLRWLNIYDSNGVLIHGLVPARRDSDGRLGVYDTVTDVFYAATGNMMAEN